MKKKNQKIKAIGLFSGGLDSILAAKLIQKQGIEVILITFQLPFVSDEQIEKIKESAKKNGLKTNIIPIGLDYMKMVRNPKYYYGSAINPCLDCRIFLLKKAKRIAQQKKVHFIFTGEVLAQRPMSQMRESLILTAKQAGLAGKLLRPLSALLLPITEAERKAWIDRAQLLGLSGRSRKEQAKLAKKYKVKIYPQPAGGCLLTDQNYAEKLSDLFKHKKRISLDEVKLLGFGRHFWINEKSKVIVGRNYLENLKLLKLKSKNDYWLELENFSGPIALLSGLKTKKALQKAGRLVLYYSRKEIDNPIVVYRKNKKIISKIEINKD